MNKDELLSHTEQRKQLWANVWAHVASASDCKRPETVTSWANEALLQFDKKFPAPKEAEQLKPTSTNTNYKI